jgi:protein-S-isoprenylcysteine O-methyltransferase Ste14
VPKVETTPIPVIAIFTLHLLYHFAVLIAWGGALAFAVSLLYLVYFYVVTLADASGDPATRIEHIAIDAALFAAFAAHHSLLARSGAKRVVARMLSARYERSFYVWVASGLAITVCVLWQPVPGLVYATDGWTRAMLIALQLVGVVVVLLATRAMSALELAGIHQAARRTTASSLRVVGPFRVVRHPIYLGWVLMVFATPTLTVNRLVFAVISTLYLILAIPWEEKSLVEGHGDRYREYQRLVRWRLIPGLW